MDASVYSRPNKPKHIAVTPVKDRKPTLGSDIGIVKTEPIAIHKSSECHVTPLCVAAKMVKALGKTEGKLLEPQGGTGSLVAAALVANWPENDITVVERHYDLVSSLQARFSNTGIQILHSCFIEYADFEPKTFDAILTNPPFKKAKLHMHNALKVLKEGGVIVALVPITFEMSGFELVEKLPTDTFEHAKVSTKIVKYTR